MGAKIYCYQELTITFSGLLWTQIVTIDVIKNLIICTMIKQIILKAKPTNTQNISFLNYFIFYYLWSYDYLCLYFTLQTKVCIVKAMVFPVVMYGCKRWIIKKTEHWRVVFDLWCWKRLLWCWRVPWTARRSNQPILKEINPEYSLEGLMLKLQHFGHLMWRADSLEKILMLGKTEHTRKGG